MERSDDSLEEKTGHLERATFAGGCFWCMQPPFANLDGVVSTRVGYTGGQTSNPTYQQVCTGTTGHTEAVEVLYDPRRISYDELLEVFWQNIDPTARDRQFADVGSQYRTGIFWHNDKQKEWAEASRERLKTSGRFEEPIATEIVPASAFYDAEEYHQDYSQKNPWRYQSYKVGSGRAAFLEAAWGKRGSTGEAGDA